MISYWAPTCPHSVAQYIDIEMQYRSIIDIVAYGTATVFLPQTCHRLGSRDMQGFHYPETSNRRMESVLILAKPSLA